MNYVEFIVYLMQTDCDMRLFKAAVSFWFFISIDFFISMDSVVNLFGFRCLYSITTMCLTFVSPRIPVLVLCTLLKLL